jgi:hypothetical protein
LPIEPIGASGYEAEERGHGLQQTAMERHEKRDKAYRNQQVKRQDCCPAGWSEQLVGELAKNRQQWFVCRKNKETCAA